MDQRNGRKERGLMDLMIEKVLELERRDKEGMNLGGPVLRHFSVLL